MSRPIGTIAMPWPRSVNKARLVPGAGSRRERRPTASDQHTRGSQAQQDQARRLRYLSPDFTGLVHLGVDVDIRLTGQQAREVFRRKNVGTAERAVLTAYRRKAEDHVRRLNGWSQTVEVGLEYFAGHVVVSARDLHLTRARVDHNPGRSGRVESADIWDRKCLLGGQRDVKHPDIWVNDLTPDFACSVRVGVDIDVSEPVKQPVQVTGAQGA